jgi:hypothetical protein
VVLAEAEELQEVSNEEALNGAMTGMRHLMRNFSKEKGAPEVMTGIGHLMRHVAEEEGAPH